MASIIVFGVLAAIVAGLVAQYRAGNRALDAGIKRIAAVNATSQEFIVHVMQNPLQLGVDLRGRLCPSIRVSRTTAAIADPNLDIDDPQFDASVAGDRRCVFASLNHRARAALDEAMDTGKVEVMQGWIIEPLATVPAPFVLEYRARRLLYLADLLAADHDTHAARLIANLSSEPRAGVRVKLIETLALSYREDPAARRAIEAAFDDPDPRVGAAARQALGQTLEGGALALIAEETGPGGALSIADGARGGLSNPPDEDA